LLVSRGKTGLIFNNFFYKKGGVVFEELSTILLLAARSCLILIVLHTILLGVATPLLIDDWYADNYESPHFKRVLLTIAVGIVTVPSLGYDCLLRLYYVMWVVFFLCLFLVLLFIVTHWDFPRDLSRAGVLEFWQQYKNWVVLWGCIPVVPFRCFYRRVLEHHHLLFVEDKRGVPVIKHLLNVGWKPKTEEGRLALFTYKIEEGEKIDPQRTS